MKLVFFQASDIHLSTTRWSDNPVLKRVPNMMAAVRSLFLDPDDVAACLLLVTGDVSFAGAKEEYDLAMPFFRELHRSLQELYPRAQHAMLFVPGNHDCDFEQDDQARRKLIQDPDPSALDDGSIVTAATAIQDCFFQFCQEFRGDGKAVAGLERLYSNYEVQLGDKHVLVRMLNSAWASQKQEGRQLVLPVDYLARKFSAQSMPDIAVTMIHHPYNWFAPDVARALRKLLEEASDIILTGHEHLSGAYTKTGLTGEQNEYVEGGVLQETNDPQSSSFNVLVIDVDKQTQEVRHFAWTGELYEAVNEVVPQPFGRNKYRLKGEFELAPDFEETLNDPEATFTHPYKDRIRLDDVFIYPDLRELDEQHSKTTARVLHGQDLMTHVLSKQQVIITASERAGKTAIARSLFKDLRRNGKIPLMLSVREIKHGAMKKLPALLDSAFGAQYSSKLRVRYWQLPKESRAVIVDDYHQLPLTKDLRDSLVRELLQRFEIVVLLGGNELHVQELMGHDRESSQLWRFAHCEVMGFGHRLRAEFIKKWYRIGREGQVEDTAMVQKAIALEKTISGILGHDLLPPYPIYLLLLLQQLESNSPLDTTAASYGRLYGAVMTAYLAKSGAGHELETKINYLSQFAYHLHTLRKDQLSDDEAQAWHSGYCTKHLEVLDFDNFRDDLVTSQVLQYRNGQLSFRYKAGFYYFVAMYLSDNLSDEVVRAEVKKLCGELYREEAANIVLFLCHLSKENLILDELLATANRLFADRSEADLLKDAEFTGKLLPALPRPMLTDGDPEKNRLRALEAQDKLRPSASNDDEAYAHHFEEDETEGEEESELRRKVSEINAAVKTIQIAGQILRNFGGRLDGENKLRVTEACYSLGMRLMKDVYMLFQEGESSLVDAARHALQEKNGMDEASARQIANALVFGLLKLITLGIIQHVSTSVGLEKLAPVFAEVLNRKPTIARRMLDLSIRLDHFGTFPIEKTLQLHKEVQGSLITLDVLRQLVFNRFYFFTAPYDIKQQICKKLDIKIQPLLLDVDPKRNV